MFSDNLEDPSLSRVTTEIEDTLGGIPDFFKSMSVRPDLTGAVWELSKSVILNGQLDNDLKLMVLLVASAQNRTSYFEDLFGELLKQTGVSEETIDLLKNDYLSAPLEDEVKEILIFTQKASLHPKGVTDQDIEDVKKLGFSLEEVIELSLAISTVKFLATWASATNLNKEKVMS